MLRWLTALNPWVILGVFAVIVGAFTWTYFYGVGVGEDKVEAKWQAREAKINAATAEKISLADARVRAAERKSADAVAAVSQTYQEKLQEKDREKDRAIAGARANGLFIATKRPATCGNTVPAVGAAPGGRDGETVAELSDPLAEYFISEAVRADKIVEQLAACQAIVMADRQALP